MANISVAVSTKSVRLHPALLSPKQQRAAFRTGTTPTVECTYDPELHVGPRRRIESAEERAAREAVAREICKGCPAQVFCGAYALRVRPSAGVWAGRTPDEIAAVAAESAASTRAEVA